MLRKSPIFTAVVEEVYFSPDSRYVTTASDDQTAQMWEVTRKQFLFTVPHRTERKLFSFSPNSHFFAIKSDDNTVQVKIGIPATRWLKAVRGSRAI